jgi:hypothetical protein
MLRGLQRPSKPSRKAAREKDSRSENASYTSILTAEKNYLESTLMGPLRVESRTTTGCSPISMRRQRSSQVRFASLHAAARQLTGE